MHNVCTTHAQSLHIAGAAMQGRPSVNGAGVACGLQRFGGDARDGRFAGSIFGKMKLEGRGKGLLRFFLAQEMCKGPHPLNIVGALHTICASDRM